LQRDQAFAVLQTQSSVANAPVPPVLSWEGVDLAYGKKQVLRGISTQLRSQEWLAIVGSNGSGKTSLASLAMGFQAPTGGLIRHHGKVVKAGQISRQAEKIAYLFQAADNMLFTASVEEELLFGLKHQKKRRDQKIEMPFTLEQLLEIVDLTAYRKRNPFHLSHGQRKRLALGALLTRYPEVLILDEPTTGQDEGHANAFLQFLQMLRERNKFTYVMITHHMDAVARYASRMIVIKDGVVFMDGAPETIFARVDELTSAGVLPMPIVQLHARLCGGNTQRVALSVNAFLRSLQPLEAFS
jgi:energy-coupling factor transport system ATP-binding protein